MPPQESLPSWEADNNGNVSDENNSHHNDKETIVTETTTYWDWKSSLSRIHDEIEKQGVTAWPALCGMVLYKVPWLISLHFVGHLGSEELAAAALASTLCNVTGLSLSVGLSSALTTLTGQSRGDLQAKLQEQQQQQEQQQTGKGITSG